jgi:hypothetical protein
MVFGHDPLNHHIFSLNAEDRPKISLKQLLDSDPYGTLKANFSIGGSWDMEGNVVILAEGDGFYVIINNDWELKVRTKDLETGETRILVANNDNPAIEAEGNNVAVRILALKGPQVSFNYPA